ncbi:MAG TPA: sigma-54 dependent transcriptional regulator [Terriglobia bacterium]|nr:sigma-54 dependent transcriptional regulator [Terriglobia bacterium]
MGTPHHLLVISDEADTSAPLLDGWLPQDAVFSQHHLDWHSATSEQVKSLSARLIIAFAPAESARAATLLRTLREWSPAAPILAVLPNELDQDLLQAAAETADDFVFWPPREHEFGERVMRLLGGAETEREWVGNKLAQEMGFAQLVGKDPTFLRTVNQIPLLAASDAPVLLLGETGTGKELCARALHHLSARRNFPFIPVDCGALPEHLAENELFGHTRGAFTDAHTEQKGLAGMAEGGTLFLDEVDSLSLTVQAKLLRFLEQRSYRSLGADRFTHANVRVLAASNRDLETLVREKHFRSDLYFRLNVLQLSLPALRERPLDIEVLAKHFLESFPRPVGAPPRVFSPGVLRTFQQYRWPGNIRELFNVVQRAVVLSTGHQILPTHITLPGFAETDVSIATTFRQARAKAVASFERLYVEEMLLKHHGNITRAAQEAHKDRRAFGRLAKKYSLSRKAI